MSDPAWKTQEPAELLWFERTNYAAVVVGTIAYGMWGICTVPIASGTNVFSGIHICVFYLTTLSLWKEKRPHWRIWLGLISVLFICGSINIIMSALLSAWLQSSREN